MLALAAALARAPLIEYLAASLLPLARAGADFALLAANTPHLVFREVRNKSPLPLISIVEATCDFAAAHKFKKLGLFGTRSTMQAGFYQNVFRERDIEIELPSVEEQSYIHEKYVGELVAGRFSHKTRERLITIAKRMKDGHGIEAWILGGTELPLLLRDDAEISIPFLDTTQIHVQAALERVFFVDQWRGRYAARNLGPGCIGGLIGAVLAAAGRDVTVIVRPGSEPLRDRQN